MKVGLDNKFSALSPELIKKNYERPVSNAEQFGNADLQLALGSDLPGAKKNKTNVPSTSTAPVS
jgi:hypothetical protein